MATIFDTSRFEAL